MDEPIKTYYLVLVSSKGGYILHSVHEDGAKARAYVECKQDDGEDATIGWASKDDFTIERK